MWQKFKDYIKNEGRGMILAIVATILIVLGFMGYLKWVGLPMTRAKNRFNEGMLLFTAGDTSAAHTKFTESLEYWDTPDAKQMAEQTR